MGAEGKYDLKLAPGFDAENSPVPVPPSAKTTISSNTLQPSSTLHSTSSSFKSTKVSPIYKINS